MKTELLVFLTLPVLGVIGTRIWSARKTRDLVARRLARWSFTGLEDSPPPTLLKRSEWAKETILQFFKDAPGTGAFEQILVQAGLEGHLYTFLSAVWLLFLAPPLVACFLDLDIAVSSVIGVVLAALALVWLRFKANARRTKFCEQLPDAIDLMIAVLKSGHSIPQAVQAVAHEVPQPCGSEFEATLHRMNLGQRLSEAMVSSAQRFDSYELDLIRRAVAIQSEVGGSLAELLEKTNSTLRDRLKLVRQAKAITAQSRLTALIVGALPAFMAVGLSFLHPGYLQRFAEDEFGRTMLIAAVGLEILGILIMRRLASIKV